MGEIKSAFFKAECGSRRLDIIRVLQKFVDKVRLIRIFVHNAALDTTHGRFLKGVGVFGAILCQRIEPLFFLLSHDLLRSLLLPAF